MAEYHTQISNFVIQELIGRGAAGDVYRAYQPSMQREVVLKIIRLEPASEDGSSPVQHFKREADVIARLEHPSIVPVYETGVVDDDRGYIALRCMRGGSLAALLKTGPLSLSRAVRMFTQLASALDYAHSRGVIHRDIKPSNVLLDEGGNAYLADFGLAKLLSSSLEWSHQGGLIGTPLYASPELLLDCDIDSRSDIYSLGVVLYHALVGRPPFQATENGLMALIYHQVNDPPPPPRTFNPSIPPAAEAVLLKALAKNPAQRYSNATEMMRELAATSSGTTSTSELKLPAVMRQPRSRLIVGFVASLMTGILLALVFTRAAPSAVKPPNIRAGVIGNLDNAEPSPDEVRQAAARMGASGFIAYLACETNAEYVERMLQQMTRRAFDYGFDLRVYNAHMDRYSQAAQIEQARLEGAKALILCQVDPTLLHSALEAVHQEGVPVAFITPSSIPYGVGIELLDYSSGYALGEAAAQWINDHMDGEANIVLAYYAQAEGVESILQGMEDSVRQYAPNSTIVARMDGASRADGAAIVQQLVDDGTSFDMIVSVSNTLTMGAVDGLARAGVDPDSVAVVGTIAEDEALGYIDDGYFLRAGKNIDVEQLGRASVQAVVKLLGGGSVPQTLLLPVGDIITAESSG